jgi:peptidyl-prolyl cis-trans isomerase SurA
VPESALEKVNPELRKAIQAASAGQITGVVKTAEGYRVFKVYSREPAGQRALTDPRVFQNIRETLLNRKDQLLKAAYYDELRNQATVTNYLSMKILEAAGKK